MTVPPFKLANLKMPASAIGIATAVLVLAKLYCATCGIAILNATSSMPIGFYKVSSITQKVPRGAAVIFWLPFRSQYRLASRPWFPKQKPLLKNLLGIPGDHICISEDTIRLNGRAIGKVDSLDYAGLPLPRWRGCIRLKQGHFFPFSRYDSHSFDGRYFGQVPLRKAVALADPFLTFAPS